MTNINEVLINFATNLQSTVSDVANFSKEQAPLVVQEFLSYKFFEHCFVAAILLFLLIGVLYALNRCRKAFRIGDIEYFLAHIMSLFSIILLSSGLYRNVIDAAKIKLAPRVCVLEYVKGLIK